jgi:hypothetical protein
MADSPDTEILARAANLDITSAAYMASIARAPARTIAPEPPQRALDRGRPRRPILAAISPATTCASQANTDASAPAALNCWIGTASRKTSCDQ